jgi:eukaryotic-like serine/threonine-protein kinase
MRMSTADRWPALKALFEAAVELPVRDRAAWLEARCAGDEALRGELESLLAFNDRPHRVFDEPAIELQDAGDEPALPPGHRIGPYRIDQLLGRGGMGAVYRATRSDETFDQQVAIKIVRRGMDSTGILRRFRSERQMLATLNHPNIATLLDGGSDADGAPYFVMEYVAGEPIDTYCARSAPALEDRLRLFLRVCAAVQHAHQRLVVHRDLKPDNILVREDGEPKLLDFGIAKLLEPAHAPARVVHTTAGFRPMTPRYASPEQVRGDPISTSTDIYSLGVLLYQLLTGRLPYTASDASPLAIERAISEDIPPRPSEAARGHAIAGAWCQRLRGDLDAIVLMALRKEPERRYRSVGQFADDVRRYLDSLPVVACPDTLSYRATKFVARNRLASAAAALATVALLAGIVATTWSVRIARREAAAATAERENAQVEAARVQQMNDFLTSVLALPDPNWYSPGAGGRADMTVADLLMQAGARIDREMVSHPDLAADLHHTLGNTYRARGFYEDARRHFESALALRRSVFGDGHPKVAESLYFLGAAEHWLGRTDRFELLAWQAVAIERTLPLASANLPHLLRDLSGVLHQRGDLDGAERLAAEALELFEQRYGADDITAAFALDVLGGLRLTRGDAAGARRLFERARSILEQSQDGSAAVPSILNRLAKLSLVEGDVTNAERLVRQAMEQDFALTGADHPVMGEHLSFLGDVLREQGRYGEAEVALRQSLAIIRARFQPTDRQVVEVLTGLSRTLIAAGRSREGEGYLREALILAGEAPVRNACAAGMASLTLGNLLRDQQRRREGEPFLEQALRDITIGCGRESLAFRHALTVVGTP